jgi:hypothetical protein
VRPTKHSSRWVIVLLVMAGLAAIQFSACSGTTEEEASGDEPASVEPIKGTSYNTIKLSTEAAERTGIKTAKIADKGGRKTVSYAAISYTPNGSTFVYTNPKALTYVRQPVTVDTVRNGVAILSKGPAAGTAVVTVGSAELFGAEYEFEPE